MSANQNVQPDTTETPQDEGREPRIKLVQLAPAAALVLILCAVGTGLLVEFFSSRPLDLTENVTRIDTLISARIEQSVWDIVPVDVTREEVSQNGAVWQRIFREYKLPPAAEARTAVIGALQREIARAGARLNVVSDGPEGMLLSLTLAGMETHVLRFTVETLQDAGEVQVATADTPDDAPAIAIIVDDLGYAAEITERLCSVAVPLTVSVLPKLAASTRSAELARDAGFEVILHLPMEAGEGEPPEPGELRVGMSRDVMAQLFEENLATVPGAVGVNNHKGSRMTTLESEMDTFMSIIAEDNLYFVDSLTTSESVALNAAKKSGLKAIGNDIFLDNEPDMVNIEERLQELMRTAERRGYAVGICHAKRPTIDALHELLPAIRDRGFRLVPVSELLDRHG